MTVPIPRRRVGDYVRIMRAPEGRPELLGETGTVTGVTVYNERVGQICKVRLSDGCHVEVSSLSLKEASR